jgi:hypothetical protein
MAFRAMDDDDANDTAGDESGDLQQSLNESAGVVREDGSPLWDGKSEIRVRRATQAEDEDWRTTRDAETKNADEGELIDSEIEDDFDDFNVYLIPSSRPTMKREIPLLLDVLCSEIPQARAGRIPTRTFGGRTIAARVTRVSLS